MTDERPTVRPVTLARLVETAHLCGQASRSTEDIEQELGVSHRRARETILETLRIGLIDSRQEEIYAATEDGDDFVVAVENERWMDVSECLSRLSPHYRLFLDVVSEFGPAQLDVLLERLEERGADTPYNFNQTGIEVVGDWGERLKRVQRNAFTGEYYEPSESIVDGDFAQQVLSIYDDLEETTGVNLRQRYLSIPEIRETVCSRYGYSRSAFDEALAELATQNVGRLELSGAPVDTGAKEARYGIKDIALSDDQGLVTTSQSTEKVMQGIEQYGKRYYYLTVHDRDLTFETHE